MKNIKFEKKDILKLSLMIKSLFPEYVNVEVKETNSGLNVVFHNVPDNFFARLFPRYSRVEKSLFELLWKDIPLRLSYRKAGNQSFTYVYLVGIMSTMAENPEFLLGYLMRKYNEIQNPYQKDFDLFMEDMNILEKRCKESFSTEKLFSTIAVVSDKSPAVAGQVLGLITKK
jgi:hypothetical protein